MVQSKTIILGCRRQGIQIWFAPPCFGRLLRSPVKGADIWGNPDQISNNEDYSDLLGDHGQEQLILELLKKKIGKA